MVWFRNQIFEEGVGIRSALPPPKHHEESERHEAKIEDHIASVFHPRTRRSISLIETCDATGAILNVGAPEMNISVTQIYEILKKLVSILDYFLPGYDLHVLHNLRSDPGSSVYLLVRCQQETEFGRGYWLGQIQPQNAWEKSLIPLMSERPLYQLLGLLLSEVMKPKTDTKMSASTIP
jgi:hypothetical protein